MFLEKFLIYFNEILNTVFFILFSMFQIFKNPTKNLSIFIN